MIRTSGKWSPGKNFQVIQANVQSGQRKFEISNSEKWKPYPFICNDKWPTYGGGRLKERLQLSES